MTALSSSFRSESWSPPVVRHLGSGAISWLFSPERALAFRLCFARVHFVGTGSLADLTIKLDSAAGEQWDVLLYTATDCGPGADLNLVMPNVLPWSFQPGDRLLFEWSGTASGGWGIEVGYLEG